VLFFGVSSHRIDNSPTCSGSQNRTCARLCLAHSRGDRARFAAFVARGITLAERNDGIVLLESTLSAGAWMPATEIKDIIVRAEVPVIAYVSERAWSAGALITLAAPQIAMAPGSSIGQLNRAHWKKERFSPQGRV